MACQNVNKIMANVLPLSQFTSWQRLQFSNKALETPLEILLFNTNNLTQFETDELASTWLTDKEYQVFTRRKAKSAKKEFVASRILIKQLVRAWLFNEKRKFIGGSEALTFKSISVCFNEQLSRLEVFVRNKRLPVTVSISHSAGQVLIAFSPRAIELGVDIEKYKQKRNVIKLSEHFYHTLEAQMVNQLGEEYFYRIWTLKESLAKASQQGIMDLLAKDTLSQLAYQFPNMSFVSTNEYQVTDVNNIKHRFDLTVMATNVGFEGIQILQMTKQDLKN
ncbi:4'-phosphopantetheinyl transferase family protein [Litorilituus lipolyticus]|nr:4'-phosphopantetheinyl transferase superfamily protein [Litorilituus lipolyticus]